MLDTSGGEKLERWGKYLLIRPDPQVIWNSPKEHPGWKKRNGHYHRSSRGGGEWEFFHLPEQWQIHYRELTFNLKPFSFKHTGLFPEQAVNWDWFTEKIRRAGRPVKVLNLFAYTGGATLAAASAGAHVTHVDASKGMVAWAKRERRCLRAGRPPCAVAGGRLHEICGEGTPQGKSLRWDHYGSSFLWPGAKGEIWKIEDAVYPLICQCEKLLSEDPLFFLVNSYTTGLAPAVLTYMISLALRDRGGHAEASEIGLPVASSGLVLPCGASGRWEK